MTILAMISPNLQDLSCLPFKTNNVTLSTTQARTGTHSFRLEYSGNLINIGHPFLASTIYLKFAFYLSSVTANCLRVRFMDISANVQVSLNVAADGTITAYRTDSNSLGASAAGVVTSGAWHVLECKVVVSNTVGEVVVKINGTTVVNVTNADTLNAYAGLTSVRIVNNSSTNTTYLYLDDIVLDSANWPGLGGLHVLVPTGNGTDTAWTGDYTAVDEIPSSDAEVISTSAETLTTRESFVFADLPASAANIRAVAVLTRSKLSAVSDGGIKSYLKSDGSNYDGSKTHLNVSYMWAMQVWETDPRDSQAWTCARVNALEAGVLSA